MRTVMKIKYLKNTHDSSVGDVKEVPDFQANILVKIGIAEAYLEDEPKFLLTPSGSPVVNDFGDLVLIGSDQAELKEEPKAKPRKPRNKK